jgi:uncharacterized membrane protein
MIEIIPNWHPIFVHFTLGLLTTAVALFAVGALAKSPQATTVARWNLWIGTVFAVITLALGYQAYYTVAHDTFSHAAMTIHLKWAWTTLVLFAIAAALAWRERRRVQGAGLALEVVLLAGVSALLVTGYLGGENVYRHGLGVMRLPQAEGPGHSHGHGGGHAHDHGDNSSADDAPPEGHQYGSEPKPSGATEPQHGGDGHGHGSHSHAH